MSTGSALNCWLHWNAEYWNTVKTDWGQFCGKIMKVDRCVCVCMYGWKNFVQLHSPIQSSGQGLNGPVSRCKFGPWYSWLKWPVLSFACSGPLVPLAFGPMNVNQWLEIILSYFFLYGGYWFLQPVHTTACTEKSQFLGQVGGIVCDLYCRIQIHGWMQPSEFSSTVPKMLRGWGVLFVITRMPYTVVYLASTLAGRSSKVRVNKTYFSYIENFCTPLRYRNCTLLPQKSMA